MGNTCTQSKCSIAYNNVHEGWPVDGNVKQGVGRANPPDLCSFQTCIYSVIFSVSPASSGGGLLTQRRISITRGSETDQKPICLINPSFKLKNI